MKLSNAFKNGKSLQWSIDHYEQVEGMGEYLDSLFVYSHFDIDNKTEEILQGMLFEPACWMWDGSIEYGIDGRYDYDRDDIYCQYRSGYYEPCLYGDIITIDNIQYRYISSIGLSEEMHIQASNGDIAYYYHGSSYVRILEIINENTVNKQYPNKG
jgi:hypothetical protein